MRQTSSVLLVLGAAAAAALDAVCMCFSVSQHHIKEERSVLIFSPPSKMAPIRYQRQKVLLNVLQWSRDSNKFDECRQRLKSFDNFPSLKEMQDIYLAPGQRKYTLGAACSIKGRDGLLCLPKLPGYYRLMSCDNDAPSSKREELDLTECLQMQHALETVLQNVEHLSQCHQPALNGSVAFIRQWAQEAGQLLWPVPYSISLAFQNHRVDAAKAMLRKNGMELFIKGFDGLASK